MAADLINELTSDDVFYDIGLHIGIYSCLAADKITSGEIILFEPDRRDFPP